MRTLKLKRIEQTAYATYGHLLDEQNRILCVTLERPWLDNAHGISCIPPQAYTGHVIMSPKRGYAVPELLDVPGRSNIEIHKGNLPTDSEGCILVGRHFGLVDDKHGITESGAAFAELMAGLHGVDAFSLEVTDP